MRAEESGRYQVLIVGPDGRRVRTLLREGTWEKGEHVLPWDGKDDASRWVPTEAYTVCVKAFAGGSWKTVLSPNTENHGIKVTVSGLQWDARRGALLLSVDRPSRIRVWVVKGDDGQIIATLKDMEPVGAGLINIPWRGIDAVTSQDTAPWGTGGFSFTGYALAAHSIIVQSGDAREYARERSRYPIEPAAIPRAYEDSSALYRYEYGDQKELRYTASREDGRILIKPDPSSRSSLREYPATMRVFHPDGEWEAFPLKRRLRESDLFASEVRGAKLPMAGPLLVVIMNDHDQWGHAYLGPEIGERVETGGSKR